MAINDSYYHLMGVAAMARLEGMKAENQRLISIGRAPAYDEQSFYREADNLEALARKALRNEHN